MCVPAYLQSWARGAECGALSTSPPTVTELVCRVLTRVEALCRYTRTARSLRGVHYQIHSWQVLNKGERAIPMLPTLIVSQILIKSSWSCWHISLHYKFKGYFFIDYLFKRIKRELHLKICCWWLSTNLAQFSGLCKHWASEFSDEVERKQGQV